MENLRRAADESRRGKLHSYGVKVFEKNEQKNLNDLHDALLKGRFRTSPYKVDILKEKKTRVLYKLPHYPDHIVEYAIVQILDPIWKKTLPFNTYSSIEGRGIHGAMKRVKSILKDRENSRYCLKIDIKKFYPSIEHSVLKMIIRKKIKCPRTLALLDEIIDSVNGYPDPLDMDKVCDGRSLPIGRYLSPHLANLVLGYLIHRINAKGIKGVVYADDGCFFSGSKEVLHALCREIDEYLSTVLHLRMKENYQVFPIARNRQDKHGRGLDFVGFVFYHEQTLIRKSTKKNFCRAAARLNCRNPLPPLAEYKQRLCSWLGWAKYSNSKHLLKTVINPKYYGKL